VDADFRVFYRIDGIAEGDYGDLSGPRFVALCLRLPAYSGVLRARVTAQMEAEADRNGGAPSDVDDIEDSLDMEVG
jgi:hypothetical protein